MNNHGASKPFHGKPSEDANAALQNFLEICNTISIRGVSQDAIQLQLFPFSLLENAKHWIYTNVGTLSTWEKCSNDFLIKFFPIGKTNLLRSNILTSNNKPENPFRRHGSDSKNTFKHALIME